MWNSQTIAGGAPQVRCCTSALHPTTNRITCRRRRKPNRKNLQLLRIPAVPRKRRSMRKRKCQRISLILNENHSIDYWRMLPSSLVAMRIHFGRNWDRKLYRWVPYTRPTGIPFALIWCEFTKLVVLDLSHGLGAQVFERKRIYRGLVIYVVSSCNESTGGLTECLIYTRERK